MSDKARVRRIGRNAGFNVVRSIIGVVVAFATGIVIARNLGPTQTGIYALAVWVAVATTIVFSDGLTHAITKYVAQYDVRTQREEIGRIVRFGIRAQLVVAVIGACALALASGLLADAFNTPDAQSLFAIAALLVVSGALIQTFSAPINALERQGLLLPLKTIWVIAHLLVTAVVLVILDAGLDALLIAQVVVWVLLAGLHFAVLSRVVSIRATTAISPSSRRRIIRTATALTVSGTLGLVVLTRSEVFMLAYFSSASDVAFYSIAYAMSDALQLVLPAALIFAVSPSISRAFADGDLQFARRAYEGQLRLTALAVTPIAVAGAVLASPVINIFYGSDFGPAAVPLAVLLFAAGAKSLNFCAIWVLVASDRERLVLWITAGGAVANLSLGLVLIPRFGVAGAAVSEALTQFLLTTASILVVWRAVGFVFPTAGFLRIFAANVPVLVAVGLVAKIVDGELMTVVVGIAAVVPAYALSLWITGALSPFEKQYLRERLAPARGGEPSE